MSVEINEALRVYEVHLGGSVYTTYGDEFEVTAQGGLVIRYESWTVFEVAPGKFSHIVDLTAQGELRKLHVKQFSADV